jgi:hypothetical protein
VRAYDLRPHNLVARPQRPGELTAVIVIEIDDASRQHIAASARSAGVPAALWLTIALEAQRSLKQALFLAGGTEDSLIAALDDAAAQAMASVERASEAFSPSLAQLRNYATALTTGGSGDGDVMVGTSVPLSPTLHVAAAWALEAHHLGIDAAEWASARTATQPVGRLAWEAASAAHGQTLAEWVLTQPVRWARSSSTSAHSPALG